jgi:hypothetical protein
MCVAGGLHNSIVLKLAHSGKRKEKTLLIIFYAANKCLFKNNLNFMRTL